MSEAWRQLSLPDVATRGFGEKLLKKIARTVPGAQNSGGCRWTVCL